MSTDLPALAHPERDVVTLEVRRRWLSPGARQALAIGLLPLLALGLVHPRFVLVWLAAALGLATAGSMSAPRALLIELRPTGVRIDGRDVSVPSARFEPGSTFRLGTLVVGDEVFPRVALTTREGGWVSAAMVASSRGEPVPSWEATARLLAPHEVGTVAPGEQRIELSGAPITPSSMGVAVGVLVAMVALATQLGANVAVAVGLVGPLGALATLGARGAACTTISVRQHGLTIDERGRHRTIAYADLRQVRAERRRLHSELVLVYRDDTEERIPVRGWPVASTVARAISHAASSAPQRTDDPEARRALDRLRATE